MEFEAAFARCPAIAILRGLEPERAVRIGTLLASAGFTLAEVPLNSPNPLASIAAMSAALDGRLCIGAGTVLTPEDAERCVAAGARYLVAPNTDFDVIAAAQRLGAPMLPGCFTATECLAAARAGATMLKLFPADVLGRRGVAGLRAVLPRAARLVAVGGVGSATIGDFAAAGCVGFGIGSELFAPGRAEADIAARATEILAALPA
jgi:2-dehydro-3-deoxyphosphogalactonate aldolase